MSKSKMDIVEDLWKKYSDYKDIAEQHEFFKLFILDNKLIPFYNDLHENYDDNHADMFIRGLTKVLVSLGIKVENNVEV